MTINKSNILIIALLLGVYTYIIMTYVSQWLFEARYWTTIDAIRFKQASDMSINMTDYLRTPLSPGLQ
jgi:hypothetical protein